MLALGPYFVKTRIFLVSIRDDPKLWIDAKAAAETGTLDGEPNWRDIDLMNAVQQQSSDLPHLSDATVAFMDGAIVGFDRFTKEFEPGGLIDQMTPDERRTIFFPATNDCNEGSLGSYCVSSRMKGNQTMEKFNARHTVNRNGTDGFLAKHLTTQADEEYLRKRQRAVEALGLTKLRKKAHMAAADEKRKVNIAKEVRREVKKVKKAAKIDETSKSLCLDIEAIKKLSDANVKAQLLFYRYQEKSIKKADRKVKPAKHLKLAAERVAELEAAVERYLASGSAVKETEGGTLPLENGDELYESEAEDE
ncbi:hypothetical protein C8J56DRAFT_780870 [Mycena floridula]|nr:hypothetical protein C8J56DRAFT_780870 [Mycena floridula]